MPLGHPRGVCQHMAPMNNHEEAITSLVRESLDSGKTLQFIVSTSSMLPFVRPGDKITVNKSDLASMKRGDIVLFDKDNELCVHRFLSRAPGTEGVVITKGDDSFAIDQPIDEGQILGRVVEIEREGRRYDLERRSSRMANMARGALSHLEWRAYRILRKPVMPQRPPLSPKEEIYHQAARNLFLNEKFFEVIDKFKWAEIPVIPLKGIALIQGIYNDPADRFVGDIDLMVKAEDVPRASAFLEGLGYSSPFKGFNPNRPYSIYLNSSPFAKPTKIPYFIHLHWHLINTTYPAFIYNIDMDEIWREASAERLGDRDILMMAPHHQIIHLCMHAFKHSYNKMGLFEDIERTVEFYKDEIDWAKVRRRAEEWGLIFPVFYSLYLTYKIRRNELLCGIVRKLKPAGMPKRSWGIISSISSENLGSDSMAYPLYLDILPRAVDKARFLIQTVFPPPSQVRRTYSLPSWRQVPEAYLRRLTNVWVKF